MKEQKRRRRPFSSYVTLLQWLRDYMRLHFMEPFHGLSPVLH